MIKKTNLDYAEDLIDLLCTHKEGLTRKEIVQHIDMNINGLSQVIAIAGAQFNVQIKKKPKGGLTSESVFYIENIDSVDKQMDIVFHARVSFKVLRKGGNEDIFKIKKSNINGFKQELKDLVDKYKEK